VRTLSLVLCSLWLLTPHGFSQGVAPGNSAVDALTALQAIEAQVKNLPAAANAQVAGLAGETRRVYRNWAANRDEPGPAPPSLDSKEAIEKYVSSLRRHIEDGERRKPGSAFHLGRVEVNVISDAVQVATASTIEEPEFRTANASVATQALNLLPGVSMQFAGARNEGGVLVRGFDARQVPLYLDGIPVYVPYDGYVDLNRFLTSDVSEMQVAKGFTSPLYGPNAIGGAINMISKAPTRPLNLDMGAGYGSGGRASGFANAGSRWRKFWVQGGFAWLSADSYPLPGGFHPVSVQPSGDRLNAYQTDYKTRLRAAWTPNDSDQYTFTYANQQGEKGQPPYAGTDTRVRTRFWQWPDWDKESFYFIANKNLGAASYMRARVYHDASFNRLKSFDDARYATQTRPSSFTSIYDDGTYGGIVELGTRRLPRQTLKGSLFFKDDTHREGNLGEPERSFRDQSFSLGAEDTVRIGERTSAVLGMSADHIHVVNAENYQNGLILPFPRNDLWSLNAQAGVFHSILDSGRLRFTFAHKTRLPTMKERYSYRLGTAIPNPELGEERSQNWEAGYSHLLGRATFIEGALFLSRIAHSTQRYYIQPNLYQLRDMGDARHTGGEFGFRTSPWTGLQFNANYTYLSRKNLSSPDLIFVDTPRHKVYSSVSYQAFPRLALMADLRYEGGRFNQNDAGAYLHSGSFADIGAGAVFKLKPGMDIQAGLGNLLDRSYSLMDGYPEAGRSAYINLRFHY